MGEDKTRMNLQRTWYIVPQGGEALSGRLYWNSNESENLCIIRTTNEKGSFACPD